MGEFVTVYMERVATAKIGPKALFRNAPVAPSRLCSIGLLSALPLLFRPGLLLLRGALRLLRGLDLFLLHSALRLLRWLGLLRGALRFLRWLGLSLLRGMLRLLRWLGLLRGVLRLLRRPCLLLMLCWLGWLCFSSVCFSCSCCPRAYAGAMAPGSKNKMDVVRTSVIFISVASIATQLRWCRPRSVPNDRSSPV